MTDATPAETPVPGMSSPQGDNISLPQGGRPTLADQHWRAMLRNRTRADLEDDMKAAIETDNGWRFRLLLQLDPSWGGEEAVLRKAVEHGRAAMFRAMVDQYPEWQGRVSASTLAATAADSGRADFVRMFVEEYKVDVHYSSEQMLRNAADKNHTEVVRYLVAQGADPNVWSNDPLRDACGHGNLEMAQILVGAGADVNASGGDPLSKAAGSGNAALVAWLLQKGADPAEGGYRAFTAAARAGDIPMLQAFLDNKVPANAKNGEALLEALAGGKLDAAELLAQNGADVNAQRGKALRQAAFRNRKDAAEFLLARHANVNLSEGRETPLTEAVSQGHEDMARLLLAHGADSTLFQCEAWEIARRKANGMESVLVKAGREQDARTRKEKNAEFSQTFGAQYTVDDLRERKGPSGDTGLVIAAQTGRFAEIVEGASGGRLCADDLYHPDDRVDTVLTLLVRHESLRQFFHPAFWADRAQEATRAYALLPEEMRKDIEMGAIANEINFRALRKKAHELNNSLKPPRKDPPPAP